MDLPQRMTQDNLMVLKEIGDPATAEHTLNSNNQAIKRRCDQPHHGLRISFVVLNHGHFSGTIEDADVEVLRLEVDPALIFVCFGIDSFISFLLFWCERSAHRGRAWEEAQSVSRRSFARKLRCASVAPHSLAVITTN